MSPRRERRRHRRIRLRLHPQSRRGTADLIRFALFIFTVWGGACVYIVWRLTAPLDAGSPWRTTAELLGVATAVLVPWAMIRQRRPHPPRLMMPAAYLAMSFAAMLLPPVVIRDVAWGVLLALDAFPDPAARHAWAHGLNAAALAAGIALTLAGWLEARSMPRIRRARIPVPGLHPDLEGLRIALVADLHAGASIREGRISAIVRLVGGMKPDLVAVAGDLADGHVRDVLPSLMPLKRLRPPLGTWFVMGNHDYYWDPVGWMRAVHAIGLAPLTNEMRVLARKRARLAVAGIPDPTGAEFGVEAAPNARAALAGAPAGALRIMLSHQPALADEAVRAGADLVLCGHTHGGQLMPWALIARKVHRCVSGLCCVALDRPARRGWLYVTTGANFWGAPNRLGVPTEVVLLTLSREEAVR